jgi:hypothetical protein
MKFRNAADTNFLKILQSRAELSMQMDEYVVVS